MGRQREGYATISERRVLDSADGCAMERLAAGIRSLEYGSAALLSLERQRNLGENVGSSD